MRSCGISSPSRKKRIWKHESGNERYQSKRMVTSIPSAVAIATGSISSTRLIDVSRMGTARCRPGPWRRR